MSKKIKVPVVILKMTDEDGNEDILAFRTSEEMKDFLFTHVRENWDEDDEDGMPDDRDAAIDDYYSTSNDDYDTYHRFLEYEAIDIVEIVNQQREVEASPVPEMGGLKTHGGF